MLSLILLASLKTYGVVEVPIGLKQNLLCSMEGAGEIDLLGIVYEASLIRTISP